MINNQQEQNKTMSEIENLKIEIEDLNASVREVKNHLSDAHRDVDQQQNLYDSARDVGAKARARTHLDNALREFDHHSRDKEELERSKREKTQKLKELQLQEREEANEPLRNQAEELAETINKKQDEVVEAFRQLQRLQSNFQSTHDYDFLVNWQNSNAQLIIEELPYFYWVNNSRKNPHYRLVKLSDRVMKT
jgi:chromosome segregation ATPase